MARRILLAPGQRAREKQAARDRDAHRLAAGEISAAELQRKNNFFASIDFSRARISAVGKKRIPAR